MRTIYKAFFWLPMVLLAWTQVGYGVTVALLNRLGLGVEKIDEGEAHAALNGVVSAYPFVSLIVAAYNEEAVIAAKVENAQKLDWPDERYEIIVAVDGAATETADRTAELARAAGATQVLELERVGKLQAQDIAVDHARGTILAFSDANAMWERTALRELEIALREANVGYVCGQVEFVNAHGTNQEGLYWSYEMWMRQNESDLDSITGGNGAIYAMRREVYDLLDPTLGHDLAAPATLAKYDWRSVYAPAAKAREQMVPTIEGEWRRKRRMMAHTFSTVTEGRLFDFNSYTPLYGSMIFSHRLLRYVSPLLHLSALLASFALIRDRRIYRLAAIGQLGLVAAAIAGAKRKAKPLLIARYYVLTLASIAAGVFDWTRYGRPVTWEAPEGTREDVITTSDSSDTLA